MKVGSFERASKITTNKKILNEIGQAVTEWQTFQEQKSLKRDHKIQIYQKIETSAIR